MVNNIVDELYDNSNVEATDDKDIVKKKLEQMFEEDISLQDADKNTIQEVFNTIIRDAKK